LCKNRTAAAQHYFRSLPLHGGTARGGNSLVTGTDRGSAHVLPLPSVSVLTYCQFKRPAQFSANPKRPRLAVMFSRQRCGAAPTNPPGLAYCRGSASASRAHSCNPPTLRLEPTSNDQQTDYKLLKNISTRRACVSCLRGLYPRASFADRVSCVQGHVPLHGSPALGRVGWACWLGVLALRIGLVLALAVACWLGVAGRVGCACWLGALAGRVGWVSKQAGVEG
jgi:hypothetical protein